MQSFNQWSLCCFIYFLEVLLPFHLQESSKTIWFGKDAFGRRSLLVHWPNSVDSRLLLSSVSSVSSICKSSGMSCYFGISVPEQELLHCFFV